MHSVASTLVLCSVPSLETRFKKILRVLKPGGTFLFIEHIAAQPGTWLRKMQGVIPPVWKAIADGCNPDRETWLAIENAGKKVNYEHFQVPYPIVSLHIIGVAMK